VTTDADEDYADPADSSPDARHYQQSRRISQRISLR